MSKQLPRKRKAHKLSLKRRDPYSHMPQVKGKIRDQVLR